LLSLSDETDGKPDSHFFHKNGDTCNAMTPEDQEISSLIFASIDECCANMFWFDMAGCVSRSQSKPLPTIPRFYPTWVRGELCSSKEVFDDWEDSYATLQECCESHFSWDMSACCSTKEMGGCKKN
jgi:hypothetical protein